MEGSATGGEEEGRVKEGSRVPPELVSHLQIKKVGLGLVDLVQFDGFSQLHSSVLPSLCSLLGSEKLWGGTERHAVWCHLKCQDCLSYHLQP